MWIYLLFLFVLLCIILFVIYLFNFHFGIFCFLLSHSLYLFRNNNWLQFTIVMWFYILFFTIREILFSFIFHVCIYIFHTHKIIFLQIFQPCVCLAMSNSFFLYKNCKMSKPGCFYSGWTNTNWLESVKNQLNVVFCATFSLCVELFVMGFVYMWVNCVEIVICRCSCFDTFITVCKLFYLWKWCNHNSIRFGYFLSSFFKRSIFNLLFM